MFCRALAAYKRRSARRIIQDFLSKDTDAKVRGLLQFLKGIGIGEQYGINAKGEATISSLLLHALQSYNFNEAEQRGFAIHRRADGKYQLSLTDIIVWGKAAFNELAWLTVKDIVDSVTRSRETGNVNPASDTALASNSFALSGL